MAFRRGRTGLVGAEEGLVPVFVDDSINWVIGESYEVWWINIRKKGVRENSFEQALVDRGKQMREKTWSMSR